MSLLDIRMSRIDAGYVHIEKAHHYDIPVQQFSSLYVPQTCDIEVSVDGGGFERVERGGLIGLPKGTAHRLRLPGEPRQARGAIAPPFAAVGTRNRMAERVFAARHAVSINPIPDLVPTLISATPAEIAADPRLKSTVSVICELADLGTKAHDPVFVRMSEALALVLIERVMERSAPEGASVDGAFHDTRLRNAIRAMHERPAEDWSLNSLAKEVGLSRSAFAETFRNSTGHTPYQYLTRVRIDAATHLLGAPNLSISEIAWQSGYQSDAAFIKAFRRIVGVSPGAYRRAQTQGAPA